MTGKARKPQVPQGKQTTRVRTETSWQDGQGGVLYGARPKYDRLPTDPPPSPPWPSPPVSPAAEGN